MISVTAAAIESAVELEKALIDARRAEDRLVNATAGVEKWAGHVMRSAARGNEAMALLDRIVAWFDSDLRGIMAEVGGDDDCDDGDPWLHEPAWVAEARALLKSSDDDSILPTAAECVCAETSTRNCPTHQNDGGTR